MIAILLDAVRHFLAVVSGALGAVFTALVVHDEWRDRGTQPRMVTCHDCPYSYPDLNRADAETAATLHSLGAPGHLPVITEPGKRWKAAA